MRKTVIFCWVVSVICMGIAVSVFAQDDSGPEYGYIRPYLSPLDEAAIAAGTFAGRTVTDPYTGSPLLSFDAEKGSTTFFANGRPRQIYEKSVFTSGENKLPNGWFYSYSYTVADDGQKRAESYDILDEYHQPLGTIKISPNPEQDYTSTPLVPAGKLMIIAEKIFGKAKSISSNVSPAVYLTANMEVTESSNYAYIAGMQGLNINGNLIPTEPDSTGHPGRLTADYIQDIFGDIDDVFDMIESDSDNDNIIEQSELEENPLGVRLFYIAMDSKGNYYLITSLPDGGFKKLEDSNFKDHSKLICTGNGTFDYSGFTVEDFRNAFYTFCDIIAETARVLGVVSGAPNSVVIEFSRISELKGQSFFSTIFPTITPATIINQTNFGGYYDYDATTGALQLFENDNAAWIRGYLLRPPSGNNSLSSVGDDFIAYITNRVNEAANQGYLSDSAEAFIFEDDTGKKYRLEVQVEIMDSNNEGLDGKGILVKTRCVNNAVETLGNDVPFTERAIYDVSQWQSALAPSASQQLVAQHLAVAFQAEKIHFNGISTTLTLDLTTGLSATMDRTISDLYEKFSGYNFAAQDIVSQYDKNKSWQDLSVMMPTASPRALPAELSIVDSALNLNEQATLFFKHGYFSGCSVRVIGTGTVRVSYDHSQARLTWHDFSGDPSIAYSVQDGNVSTASVWEETSNGYQYTYQPVVNGNASSYKISKYRENLFSITVEEGDTSTNAQGNTTTAWNNLAALLTPQQMSEIIGVMTAKLEEKPDAVACPIIYMNSNQEIVGAGDKNIRYRVRISGVDVSGPKLQQGEEAVKTYICALLGDNPGFYYVVEAAIAGSNVKKEYLVTSLPPGGHAFFNSTDASDLENYATPLHDSNGSLAVGVDDAKANLDVSVQLLVERGRESGIDLTDPSHGLFLQLEPNSNEVDDLARLTGLGRTYTSVISDLGINDAYTYSYNYDYVLYDYVPSNNGLWQFGPVSYGRVPIGSGTITTPVNGVGELDDIIFENMEVTVGKDFVQFLNAAVNATGKSFSADLNSDGIVAPDEVFSFGLENVLPKQFFVLSGGHRYKLEIKLEKAGNLLKVYTRCVKVDNNGNELPALVPVTSDDIEDIKASLSQVSGMYEKQITNVVVQKNVTPIFSLAGKDIDVGLWKTWWDSTSSSQSPTYDGQQAVVQMLGQAKFGINAQQYTGYHPSGVSTYKSAEDILDEIAKPASLPATDVFAAPTEGSAARYSPGGVNQLPANVPPVACAADAIGMTVSGGYTSSGSNLATLTITWPAFTDLDYTSTLKYYYRVVKVDGGQSQVVSGNVADDDGWVDAGSSTSASLPITTGSTYQVNIYALDVGSEARIASSDVVTKEINTYVAAPVAACSYNRSNQSQITIQPVEGVTYKYAVYTADPQQSKTWQCSNNSTLDVSIPDPAASNLYAYVEIIAVNTKTGVESAPVVIRPYTAHDILYMINRASPGNSRVWKPNDIYNGEMGGDVDGDGVLTMQDFMFFNYYFTPPSGGYVYTTIYIPQLLPLIDTIEEEVLFLQRADVNGNGVVTQADDGAFFQTLFMNRMIWPEYRSDHSLPAVPWVYGDFGDAGAGMGITYPYLVRIGDGVN